jgi:hypothetical protein
MLVNLRGSGMWIFTGDQYHIKENYEQSHPQGMFVLELGRGSGVEMMG